MTHFAPHFPNFCLHDVSTVMTALELNDSSVIDVLSDSGWLTVSVDDVIAADRYNQVVLKCHISLLCPLNDADCLGISQYVSPGTAKKRTQSDDFVSPLKQTSRSESFDTATAARPSSPSPPQASSNMTTAYSPSPSPPQTSSSNATSNATSKFPTTTPIVIQASTMAGQYHPITHARHPKFPGDYPVAAWADTWEELARITDCKEETEAGNYADVVKRIIV